MITILLTILKEMQARVQELRSKASASRQRIDEARSNQAANTSQNRVLDGLTRLRTSGRITGFHVRATFHVSWI